MEAAEQGKHERRGNDEADEMGDLVGGGQQYSLSQSSGHPLPLSLPLSLPLHLPLSLPLSLPPSLSLYYCAERREAKTMAWLAAGSCVHTSARPPPPPLGELPLEATW